MKEKKSNKRKQRASEGRKIKYRPEIGNKTTKNSIKAEKGQMRSGKMKLKQENKRRKKPN